MIRALLALALFTLTAHASQPFRFSDPALHPFRPHMIVGTNGLTSILWARYQPYRAMQMTLNGSGVSVLNDTSGNFRHLTNGTAANQPYLTNKLSTGLNSLYFNGTSHFLKSTNQTLNQPEFIAIGVKQVSWASFDRFYDGSDSTHRGLLGQNTSSPKIAPYAGSFLGDSSALSVGAYGVVSVAFNGANSFYFVNLGSRITGDAGAQNMTGFTLGAGFDGNAAGNMEAVEILVFSGIPTANAQSYIVQALGRLMNVALW